MTQKLSSIEFAADYKERIRQAEEKLKAERTTRFKAKRAELRSEAEIAPAPAKPAKKPKKA